MKPRMLQKLIYMLINTNPRPIISSITTSGSVTTSLEIVLTIQISYMQPNYWPGKATQHQTARNTSIGTPAK